MFGSSVNSGLTFAKVLGGISKTLNIANQVIPIYREAKPMINNAKNILSVLKDFNISNSHKNNTLKENNKKDTVNKEIIRNNGPNFFL